MIELLVLFFLGDIRYCIRTGHRSNPMKTQPAITAQYDEYK